MLYDCRHKAFTAHFLSACLPEHPSSIDLFYQQCTYK